MSRAAVALTETAPAKINLALHVTGRRGDGYHLLDSLVVFAHFGDRLSAEPAGDLSLAVEGPMAAGLAGADNLVLRAAEVLRARARRAGLGARLVLEKNLPVASGIGGGSADAAAALRLLDRLWRLGVPAGELARLAAGLGADVPVCLIGHPARMRGIGEIVEERPGLPALPLLLVNPGVVVSTPEVFARLERRHNAGLPDPPPVFAGPADLAGYLARCRNDLQAAAVGLEPVIAEALAAIVATPGCLLARMSGSGATCFGLYADAAAAAAARDRLARGRPGWWCCATETGPSG